MNNSHKIFWSYSPLVPSPAPLLPTLTPLITTNHPLNLMVRKEILCVSLNLISVAYVSMGVGIVWCSMGNLPVTTPLKKMVLPPLPSYANRSLVSSRGPLIYLPPPNHDKMLKDPILCLSSWLPMPRCAWKTALYNTPSHLPALTFLLSLISRCFPEPWRGRWWYFGMSNCHSLNSHLFSELWLVMSIGHNVFPPWNQASLTVTDSSILTGIINI